MSQCIYIITYKSTNKSHIIIVDVAWLDVSHIINYVHYMENVFGNDNMPAPVGWLVGLHLLLAATAKLLAHCISCVVYG